MGRSNKGHDVRKLALLLLCVGLGPVALAATRVTVQQVEELLAAERKHSDERVARKIADLELTERASSARLSRWKGQAPGTQTRDALLALADASAFMDLPAADLPPTPMPDAAEQERILSQTVEYVKTTVHKLPNFLARRSTTHYDDQHPQRKNRQYQAFAPDPTQYKPEPLRVVTWSANVVTYRDGLEVKDTEAGKSEKLDSPEIGLTTSGEFGPILSQVIGDATSSQLSWSHWELGATGPLAVLRYAVPREKSRYAVSFGAPGAEWRSQFPAYHGEITVDPASGTILRVTLVADLRPPWQTAVAAVLVEYGSVTIGNAEYICPVRGVALTRIPSLNADDLVGLGAVIPAQTYLNDVTFTEYRLFRGDVRVLP